MPEGGRLTITTRAICLSDADVVGQDGAQAGDYVDILETDTGIGMDDVTRGLAFDPFFTTKPLGQGTGLGLSQLYGFVRQSNGLIGIDSAVGRGTTVRVSLRRHQSAGRSDAAPASRTAPFEGGKHDVVLLVEDEEVVRSVAAEQLRDLGYEVLGATDGAAALDLLHPMKGGALQTQGSGTSKPSRSVPRGRSMGRTPTLLVEADPRVRRRAHPARIASMNPRGSR